MKPINLLLLLTFIIFNSCGIKKENSKIAENYSIVIKKQKGTFKSKESIKLFVDIFNNTNEDITILNPKTRWGTMLHFFNSLIKCDNPNDSFGESPESQKNILRDENDLVKIKAKSSEEFEISGTYYDLICDSDEVLIKIGYNSTMIPRFIQYSFFGEDNIKTKELYKKITKLNIESKETLIKLK